jgi:hypothetical protein
MPHPPFAVQGRKTFDRPRNLSLISRSATSGSVPSAACHSARTRRSSWARHSMSCASSSRSSSVSSLARSSPLSSSSSFSLASMRRVASSASACASVRSGSTRPSNPYFQCPEPPPRPRLSGWRLEAASTHSHQCLIHRFRAFIHHCADHSRSAQQVVVLVEGNLRSVSARSSE